MKEKERTKCIACAPLFRFWFRLGAEYSVTILEAGFSSLTGLAARHVNREFYYPTIVRAGDVTTRYVTTVNPPSRLPTNQPNHFNNILVYLASIQYLQLITKKLKVYNTFASIILR